MSPSPAASPVRNARSCPIWSAAACRRFSAYLSARLRARSACAAVLFFFSLPSALSVNSVLILSLYPHFVMSLLLTSSAVPKQNHIPLLHNVVFPLQSHLRLLPRRRQTPRRQQIIPPHHFRPNKTLLDIAMNRPRRLHRRRSLSNRPRPH